MLVCKRMSSNPLKNEIVYKLFTHKSTYIHLTVSKQMPDVKIVTVKKQYMKL